MSASGPSGPLVFLFGLSSDLIVNAFMFKVPPTAKVIWRQSHSLIRQTGGARDQTQNPGYKVSGYSLHHHAAPRFD